MAVLKKAKPRKEIDWKEMAKDLRADLVPNPFSYRATTYFK